MKLDMNPFPVSMVELEHKKILVCTDQGQERDHFQRSSQPDDHPHNLEIGVRKENFQRKPAKRVKPTLAMLIEKYQC
jgi:hypothetical protein